MQTNLKFNITTVNISKQQTDCIIVAIYEKQQLSKAARELDQVSHGYLSKILKSGDISGKLGEVLVLHNVAKLKAARIMLVGYGKATTLTPHKFHTAISACLKKLLSLGAKNALYIPLEDPIQDPALDQQYDFAWQLRQISCTVASLYYSFTAYKSKPDLNSTKLQQLDFAITKAQQVPAIKAITTASAIVHGMNFAKDLANTPPNICTPNYLASAATKLAKTTTKLKTTVLNKAALKRLGMNAILAVGQGSQNPPALITMEYMGGPKKQAPIVLVGKGITFDTGGNSLKAPTAMIGQKYDMCGAASVFGTIVAAIQLKLPINIIGVIASAENMPGGSAIRPNDIITSYAGTTIEILNTDAEGRLVLCDALAYCARFKPKVVIDIATLTGACIIALGNHFSGLYTNHQPLATALLTAGNYSNDKCWQMPLPEEYQAQLNSKIADLKNVGNSGDGGSITGACFLSRFTENYHWAHLDIAGTAWDRNHQEGASGRPVPMLIEYLINSAGL